MCVCVGGGGQICTYPSENVNRLEGLALPQLRHWSSLAQTMVTREETQCASSMLRVGSMDGFVYSLNGYFDP
jgi:hypothetical protein